MAETDRKQTGLERLAALFEPPGRGRAAGDVRIGLAGGGPLLAPAAAAYSSLGLKKPPVMYAPDTVRPEYAAGPLKDLETVADFDDFARRVDAVEVFDFPEGRSEFAIRLLEAGRHVSLQKPFARSMEEAQALARAAGRRNAVLRINEYALFYEPYIKLKELIDAKEIGEVCAIRFRSNLAGADGVPWPELLTDGDCFFHPAFDRFALAEHLLGGVESVICYSNRLRPKKGGTAVVGFKYKAAGCYGVFDLTYAPGTAIRADCVPCDDQIEVAGTDGIIWANHFHGKMTEEPWLEVRRGKKHYTLGIGSDMAVEWKDCLGASARHFLECAAGRAKPRLSPRAALRALRFQLAAAEAARTGSEVKV